MNQTIRIPIKQLIQEAGVLSNLKDTLDNVYDRFFKYFKFLNKDEFEVLMEIVFNWNYLNNRFPKKPSKELKDLLHKIRNINQDKLPNYIYRGLNFKTEAEMKKFLKDSKISIVGENSEHTAWSSSQAVAKKFIPGGRYCKPYHEYGVYIKIPKRVYKKYLFFTLHHLLETDKDKLDFLKLAVKKETSETINWIKDKKNISGFENRNIIGYQLGAKYAILEKEFILNKILAHEDIRITEIRPREK